MRFGYLNTVQFIPVYSEHDPRGIVQLFGKGEIPFLFQALKGIPQGKRILLLSFGEFGEVEVELAAGPLAVTQLQETV